VNVTTESAGPTEVTLSIAMEPEDEEPFITRSYRRVVKQVRIPGFRPGKAPRSVVESHVGRAALVQEALDFMVPETLDQVLKKENLEAFSEPELEILETEPVSFKAVVPLEPLVELGEYQAIRLERQPVEVTDSQVDEVIEQLRQEAAPWEPADRPVKFGDLVSLDIDGNIAGEQAIDDHGVDFIPQQDNPMPVPGFSIYLEGMSEGQEKEFTLTIAEDHHQPNYAGKECRLHVRVLSIKEKKLPELDDEFAKGVREGYESIEALTTFVRGQLTTNAEAASLRQLEQDSLEELLKIATIQASGLIYQRELDGMYEERERSMRNQRIDMDTYLSYIGKTEEQWREQLKPQAEQRLNTYLVLRKLAKEESIDVSSEEIQGEIESLLSETKGSEEATRQALSSDSAKTSIRSMVFNRKVMQRLVQIVEGQASEPAASDSSGEPEQGDDETAPQSEEPADARTEDPEGNEEGTKPDAD
jgi:trigger factor